MTRQISQAESWTQVYEAFNQINFTAFDYNSIKQSIINYIQLYFPESFNDFIESSELIAMIEVFAYLGEALIYRVDVGSHENFIGVAQRKQSVLRLAKLISYKTTRNLPARGLLKITSVSTTQQLYDSKGNNLQNSTVLWNDVNNTAWNDQFTTIMNAASSSNFGTVAPNDRIQVDNVLFELYSLNSVYTNNGVIPYVANVNGASYGMEVVPTAINAYGPLERRPEYNSNMTYLYGSDGFGNDSPTTGFFLFTKQGSLSKITQTFDGKTPNQYFQIPRNNINDTDLWVNNIDPTTNLILDDGTVPNMKSGEWVEVDTTTAENVIFSYTSTRNRYETENLENDQVRVAFGDGIYANIPSGTFDLWYRVSSNTSVTIPQNSVVDEPITLQYTDILGNVQTLSMTVSLVSNLQNGSESEDIEHIRANAPSVYYTQNRMVSAADYNLYPLKDPTILKLNAVNRTYTGQSKFSYWYDASSTYENVKIVGNDMSVVFEDSVSAVSIATPVSASTVVLNYLVPILSNNGFNTWRSSNYFPNVRTNFTTSEILQINQVLNTQIWPDPVWITYDPFLDQFTAVTSVPSLYAMMVVGNVISGVLAGWTINYQNTTMIVESPTTFFWAGNGNVTVPYDTLIPGRDTVVILQANPDNTGNRLLSDKITLNVTGLVNSSDVTASINQLQVSALDSTLASMAGYQLVGELLDPSYVYVPIAPLTTGVLASTTSAPGSATTLRPPVPTLTVSADINALVTISWTAPIGIVPTGYSVVVQNSTTTLVLADVAIPAEILNYVPTGLVVGESYEVYVIANYLSGQSATQVANFTLRAA